MEAFRFHKTLKAAVTQDGMDCGLLASVLALERFLTEG